MVGLGSARRGTVCDFGAARFVFGTQPVGHGESSVVRGVRVFTPGKGVAYGDRFQCVAPEAGEFRVA